MAKITDPYLNKVLPQHKIRKKFMAYLSAYLEKLEDVAEALRQMDGEFDLDNAAGNQLDVLGSIIGAPRLLDFEPYYAPPLLPDDLYRLVIRAKISLNQWDGTIEGIYNLWNEVFTNYRLLVRDNQDMSMTLRVYDLENLFESEFMARGFLAPKPEGVLVNYEFILERNMDTELYLAGYLAAQKQTLYFDAQEPEFNIPDGLGYVGVHVCCKITAILETIERGDQIG